jgi:putative transposase
MPRRGRIDAPRALHHVICRGTERRTIFREDSDRDDFLKRLETILSATQTPCYAWTDSWDVVALPHKNQTN